MTKIIVAGGVGRFDVEIIDLDSSSTACSRIANLPEEVYGSVGILGPNQQPLICGGYTSSVYSNVCYILESGQWQVTNEMNEKRVHAAISPSPYPSNDFSAFVTGGYDDGVFSDSVEVWNQNVWTLSPTKMPHVVNLH